MHQIIAGQLATFITEHLGKSVAPSAIMDSKPGLDGLPEHYYYYHDVHEILREVSRRRARTFSEVAEEFGRQMGPELLKKYGELIGSRRSTLEIVAKVEMLTHGVLLMNEAGITAEIACELVSPHELSLTYTSPRMLCAVVRGIAWSIGVERSDRVMISEPQCMLHGDPECRMTLTTAVPEQETLAR
ncbi:MAG TPA: heme NO-binding domain-containing protein [Candidatus Dormibacteraeota bacterium]|nr:heme NO-binding domain-containing protein [Candidatus Dormibacteraeota bacterium]